MKEQDESGTINLEGTRLTVRPEKKAFAEENLRRLSKVPVAATDKLKVRRVLCAGSVDGIAAAWAFKRFDAWVDVLVEHDSEVQCWENYPPGYSLVRASSGQLSTMTAGAARALLGQYQIVHIGAPKWLPLRRHMGAGQMLLTTMAVTNEDKVAIFDRIAALVHDKEVEGEIGFGMICEAVYEHERSVW